MKNPKTDDKQNWPIKAYNNPNFLNSQEAREIRVLCELMEPGQRFAAEGVEGTLVLFGSARTRTPAQAQADLDDATDAVKDPGNPTAEETRRLHFARCNLQTAKYYTAAADLAESLTRWSLELPEAQRKQFVICSGGGPGIMEAANEGAARAGGKSVGLGISLPFEQTVNGFIPDTLKFEFHYFFTRKYWFVHLAKALIAFPGGFGTLDELFETLTLVQTGKTKAIPPIVLFGSEFWNEVVDFDALVRWGTISPEDLDRIHVVDDVKEAKDFLIGHLTKRYLADR
ncbi:MAG: TIGR00730 family Rossman fold protein [Coraliomargaritaceae bacterium]